MIHPPRSIRTGLLTCILAAGVLLGMPLAGLADTVWVGSGASALEYKNARVTSIRGDTIIYEINSREISRPINTIQKIHADNEPAFNAAEDAFVAGDWDKAATNYERALQTSTREWVKAWSQRRNLDAATRAGRFDVAVRQFVVLARTRPADAVQALPPLPAPSSTYLKDAVKALQDGINSTNADASKVVMLELLQKIAAHMGDARLAEESARTLTDLRIRMDPNSDAAMRAAVTLLLATANKDLQAGEFDKAIRSIEQSAGRIIEVPDQVEALWLLAEAMAAKAGDSKDPAVWRDVTLAYIRLVAYAPPANRRVPQALMKAAALHAGPLADRPAAIKLYKSIIEEYKTHDVAREAQAELEKLEKA
jgi:tetratricopeptide (TPR) repeat protein